MRRLVVIVLLLLSAAGEGWGTSYYVSQLGTVSADVNNATGPCNDHRKTMTAEAHNAFGNVFSPGDIVYLCNDGGTIESVQVKSSGTAGNPIIYTVAPGQTSVTLKPSTDHPPFLVDKQSYVSLIGNVNVDGSSVNSYPSVGIRDSSYITIDGVTVRDSKNHPSIGIDLDAPASDSVGVLVTNCSVKNGASTNGHGIFAAAYHKTFGMDNLTITDCVVDNVAGAGIRVSGRLTNSLISNNTVSNAAIGSSDWGIYASGWRTTVSGTGNPWSPLDGANRASYVVSDNTPVVGFAGPTYFWFSRKDDIDISPGQFFFDNTTTPNRLYVNYGGADPNTHFTFIVYAWADNVTIEHNTVSNTRNPTGGDGHGIGLEVAARNSVVRYNKSYSNGDFGQGSGFASWGNRDNKFVYNVSYGNLNSGINIGSCDNVSVENNTTYNNSSADVGFAQIEFISWGTGTARNNVGYNGFGRGLLVGGYMTVTHDHNLMFGNPAGNWAGTATKGATDIELDPQMVDPAGYDFRLKSSSPLIGAGINVGLTTDFAGMAVKIPPSIGAFESTFSTGEVPTPPPSSGSGGGGCLSISRVPDGGADASPAVSLVLLFLPAAACGWKRLIRYGSSSLHPAITGK